MGPLVASLVDQVGCVPWSGGATSWALQSPLSGYSLCSLEGHITGWTLLLVKAAGTTQ